MDWWYLAQEEKRQRLAPPSSRQPVRRMELSLAKMVTLWFFEEDFVTMVAELDNSNKIIFEGRHDLGVADR